jgi:hypothetical protein
MDVMLDITFVTGHIAVYAGWYTVLALIVSIPLLYEYDIHTYYTVFSLTQLNFFIIDIREATCFGVFKPPSPCLILDE